ncbi:MAG: sulfate adenylyltransferase, partial [Halobacteria archaeon]|nr:sulfate adenylyltransferase [Halobacteria archaeon]
MAAEPHGGELVNRVVELTGNVEELHHLELDRDEYMDLEMIATGAYSPLEGFMGKDDFERVLDDMRLADGTPWSIPVVLATDEDVPHDKHILTYEGETVGSIDVEEV